MDSLNLPGDESPPPLVAVVTMAGDPALEDAIYFLKETNGANLEVKGTGEGCSKSQQIISIPE